MKRRRNQHRARADDPAIYGHSAIAVPVIPDWKLPDGMEQPFPLRRRIRIIAISGGGRYVNSDLLPIAQSVGADAVLAKPFEAEDLLEPLRRLCVSLSPEANANGLPE